MCAGSSPARHGVARVQRHQLGILDPAVGIFVGLLIALLIFYLRDKAGVNKAKIEASEKLPPPTTVKEVRSFLGHAGFYRRFIQNFSKIAKPMCDLLVKDTPFDFNKN